MQLASALVILGVILRQADRVHFARNRPRAAGASELIALQRTRLNNLTPLLVLVGTWTQIAGWWLLAAHGPLLATVAAIGVAVHFRHLQETSHFAVHGVLARSRRANHVLAEVFVHHPLALGPVSERRERHVRGHHPHATLATDPNLVELNRAGLRPGVGIRRLAAALVHPLTPTGIQGTCRGLASSLSGPGAWHRIAATAAVAALAYLIGGWPSFLAGFLAPRLLLYPQLAWTSLLVEHTWFDPERRTGTPAQVEAGRCLRLYPRNRALAVLASLTWLPYGDLHHYAHSAHPSVRWNYLPALEAHLGPPHFTPDGLLLGTATVARRHHRALAGPAGVEHRPARV